MATSVSFSLGLGYTTRIGFGSCADQEAAQPIWSTISAQRPDAFVFLGDNVYADSQDINVVAGCYAKLGAIPEFKRFRNATPILATWDDHDYGRNDGGSQYPLREQSKRVMLDFFNEPLSSPRRRRPGVYTSHRVGRAPFDVQVLLLDLRWFRSPLTISGAGPYRPGQGGEMLGEDQWLWLENELRQPAGARIIASSIQLISSEHGWEKWANFPTEKARLEKMLERLAIRNAVVISGDMHFAEISTQRLSHGFELADFTASGLTHFDPAEEGNSRRLALYDRGTNFGMIEVDWARRIITGEILDSWGLVRGSRSIPISVHSAGS